MNVFKFLFLSISLVLVSCVGEQNGTLVNKSFDVSELETSGGVAISESDLNSMMTVDQDQSVNDKYQGVHQESGTLGAESSPIPLRIYRVSDKTEHERSTEGYAKGIVSILNRTFGPNDLTEGKGYFKVIGIHEVQDDREALKGDTDAITIIIDDFPRGIILRGAAIGYSKGLRLKYQNTDSVVVVKRQYLDREGGEHLVSNLVSTLIGFPRSASVAANNYYGSGLIRLNGMKGTDFLCKKNILYYTHPNINIARGESFYVGGKYWAPRESLMYPTLQKNVGTHFDAEGYSSVAKDIISCYLEGIGATLRDKRFPKKGKKDPEENDDDCFTGPRGEKICR